MVILMITALKIYGTDMAKNIRDEVRTCPKNAG